MIEVERSVQDEESSVCIVGSGAAGLSACARLLERGRRPLLLSRGLGASEMGSGAADLFPWTTPRADSQMTDELSESLVWAKRFLSTLECFSSEHTMSPSQVVSFEGLVRPTELAAKGLLELSCPPHSRVGVWDVPRDDWCAELLCSSLTNSAWSRQRETTFVPVKFPGIVRDSEYSLPLAAFARLFDEGARAKGFLAGLPELKERCNIAALLCGPWLGSGVDLVSRARELAFGESLSPPEGPFGLRFGSAGEKWLIANEIELYRERVVLISRGSEGLEISCESAGGETKVRQTRACVVAAGGLIGGGVEVSPGSLGAQLRPSLSSIPSLPRGAYEGWDPQGNAGSWVWPPHFSDEHLGNELLRFAGDVASIEGFSSPSGTLLGAVISGKQAVDQLLG